MFNFLQYSPTEIAFGKETEEQAGKLARKWGATKVLLVYGGGSVVRSGLLDRVKKSLEEEGILWKEFGGVCPNPRLSYALEGVEVAKQFQADLILAVGGGSAIDTGKAIAIGAANPEKHIWNDYWMKREAVEKALPVGVVLTIPAAGSETSDSAVLTNEEEGRKKGLSTPFNRPKFAIMNPVLATTLPKYQVACGVVDIMMHTLERYFTPVSSGNTMTDEIAEGLLRTVVKFGKKAVEDPADYEAMSEVMWCGSLSHNGITGLGRPGDFMNHKMGHELSARFDEVHGASLSIVWPSWARYVYKTDIPRFAHYAEAVWGVKEGTEEEKALAGIEKTEAFFQSIQAPVSMAGMKAGIQSEEVLLEMADNATNHDEMKLGSFVKMGTKEIYDIFKMANH